MRWRATWSTRWVTDMAAHVPKVHVVIRALDRNHGGFLLGLSMLADSGRIRLVQEMQRPPERLTSGPWHLRDKDDSNIEIRVDDRASGFLDFHDSWELNEAGLRDHDVYFKRSLDLGRHPDAAQRKLEPLGLVYEVRSDGLDWREAARIVNHVVPLDVRLSAFRQYALHSLASWFGAGPRPVLSLLSAPPDPALEPRTLFSCGLWDPAGIARHDPSRVPEFEAINLMRANCVRQLRTALGAAFTGGTQHGAFARSYAPDTLMPDARASSKRTYLQTVRRHPICIATMGLHGSNGCKLAEYIALSRAIVSEPLRYQLPGPFAPETHYLPFTSPEECVARVTELMQSQSLREKLMRANWAYYQEWMRPDAFAGRIVERIRARG